MITFSRLGHMGRFGNQMFQIAATIGIARANDHDYSFPLWINYDHRDRFMSSDDCELYKYFRHPLPLLKPASYTTVRVPWGYRRVRLPEGTWDLSGYMQSEKYFKHVIEEIRYYLTLSTECSPLRRACAIHYRAGDYGGSNVMHPRLEAEYYRRAIALLPRHTSLLLFTDDQEAATSIFGNTVEYVAGNYIEHFRMMKACEHFVTANSSFSVMAAILATSPTKTVICPSRWFGEGSRHSPKDCYPANAQVI